MIAFNTFEHVQRFWVGFEEVYRVLRPDGVFVLSCPFYFHQHDYPSDYWRFTPQAFEFLLAKYPARVLGLARPRAPAAERLGGRLPRGRRPADAGAVRVLPRRCCAEYAREPLSPGRRLLYGLGRVLCGRRPFAPYLDRDRWETELHQGPACGRASLTLFPRTLYNASRMPPARPSAEREAAVPVQMELKRIIISEVHEQQVIMLKEVDGDRSFPIVIGIFEATSIDRRVKGMPSPRPLTHDLVASVIENMGGELRDIYISELRDHTYYAKLRIRLNGENVEVDSRPSDAIALAVTAKVPIYVAEDVLDEVCGE